MYDRREGITFQVEQTLVEQFRDAVFNTRIRINTKQKSAPGRAQTIFEYEAGRSGKGAADFEALTGEVLGRIEGGSA
jgi:cellulose biosynthesis protein BcsQ